MEGETLAHLADDDCGRYSRSLPGALCSVPFVGEPFLGFFLCFLLPDAVSGYPYTSLLGLYVTRFVGYGKLGLSDSGFCIGTLPDSGADRDGTRCHTPTGGIYSFCKMLEKGDRALVGYLGGDAAFYRLLRLYGKCVLFCSAAGGYLRGILQFPKRIPQQTLSNIRFAGGGRFNRKLLSMGGTCLLPVAGVCGGAVYCRFFVFYVRGSGEVFCSGRSRGVNPSYYSLPKFEMVSFTGCGRVGIFYCSGDARFSAML